MRPSPWGDLEVADAHIHFFSRNFFRLLCAPHQLNPDEALKSLGWRPPPEDSEALAGEWIVELDRQGIGKASLIASLPGDEASVVAAVHAFPDRFRGYAMVNPCLPGALDAVDALLASGGVQGICLFPAMHRYSMHDERAEALVGIAATHPGTVVFVHCGALSVGVRKRLGLPSPFDMGYSNPLDLHHTAARYPQVHFVVPHFGAGLLREALLLCDLCPNVVLDTSSSNSWMRYEGLTLREVFARALAVAGPKRLVFGSDSSFFPRGWNSEAFEVQVKALHELHVELEVATDIFARNFDRLFDSWRAPS